MMTLIITTQYRENYAAHNENYEHGIDEAYWKMKGGTVYYVDDLTEKNISSINENGISEIGKLITYSNEMQEEYIIDYEIKELGKGSDPICDEWETPIQLWYDFSTSEWKARTYKHDSDEFPMWSKGIIARAQQWTLLPAGDRHEYACQYKTKNGWFDQKDKRLKEEIAA
jgi:hypothetical protein